MPQFGGLRALLVCGVAASALAGTPVLAQATLKVAETDLQMISDPTGSNSFDLNLYANDLFKARARVGNGGVGRTNCDVGSVDCSVYSNYNPFVQPAYQPPRMVGAQANYRF